MSAQRTPDSGMSAPGVDRGQAPLLVIRDQDAMSELVAHLVDYMWNHSKLDVSPTLLAEALTSYIHHHTQQEDETEHPVQWTAEP